MTDAVTIISPELRPGKGGVGDHTLRLLEAWRSTGSFKVVVPLQGLEVNPSLSIPIEPLAAEATDVVRQLPRRGGSVLVQYSAYGFDSRGYPHRLIQALLDWKKHNSGRLVIVFHEIWTFWPLLNMNRAVQCFHRRGIRHLVGCADAVFTTTQSQAAHLNKFSPQRSVQVLPVGSNIRRRQAVQGTRKNGDAVLFGLQAARIRTLKKMKNSLSRLAAAGRLSKITTVGAGESDLDVEERLHLHDLALSGAFEQRGIQNESEISELLLTAAFGISGQDELSYEKSGTFMAYAAHELNILSEYGGEDSGEPLCWLITPAELQAGIPEPELRDRAKQLRAWQERTSSWELIARKLSEALQLNVGATVFSPVAGQ